MSTIDDPLVQFVNVQKSYDGKTLVVKDLNLDVLRGEFLTMLGPSGSGKTTCLLMLAGFEPTTKGTIILDGRPITTVPPHRRGIGMVFQNFALFPHMTVAENLSFPLEVRKMEKPKIRERVRRALDMVRLSGYQDRRPTQLSGGQQQRVAVARALIFEPDLVLMDEPLGALDKNLREQMQLEIKRIHEALGVTVVYVTHDQSEALTMSNRIAVFNDGEIQQLATPDVLYEEPVNSFVAHFIGENNRLNGNVRDVNGRFCTVDIDGHGVVRALAVNIEGTGSATSLSLRPERVTLNPGDDYPNVFDARVEEMIYLGDHIRTRLNVLGHDDFVINIPNVSGYTPVSTGQSIKVGWKVDDCRALDCASPKLGPAD